MTKLLNGNHNLLIQSKLINMLEYNIAHIFFSYIFFTWPRDMLSTFANLPWLVHKL